MKERKYIVDTTLRDGEQSPSVNFTRQQKITIASLLDNAGVSQIEVGIPSESTYEKETICQIIENMKNAKIAVWSRLSLSDLQHCIDCRPDIIHISIPVSDVQIHSKLQKDKNWILEQLFACLELLINYRMKNISIGFEDAFRSNDEFMNQITAILLDFNIRRIRLSDTVGIATPSLCRYKFGQLSLSAKPQPEFGFHGHNDLGMALANTIESLKSFCSYADTTLLGIGERTGNCDFLQLIRITRPIFNFGVSIEKAEKLPKEFLKITSLA
ncbi:hypothetical protein NIE88_03615 [Sporolactobacillus shoreicorticis]|uniref:Pyruvate carboxyltransferase domain-containing protein n=1 Tax=Sporolactobacillus shoreicorticis TaxID=1923877 RepID=A0ABW5RXD9_9BACL|nr:hypothetical protein [Sporolactobacillus shoreicorticis]MCO7124862.1 hypothetical protein [Sporolactobacillus shoreicorticis]